MTDHEIRQLVLQYLYDNRSRGKYGVPIPKIAEFLKLEKEVVKSAARQLQDLNQADYEPTVGGEAGVSITTYGINKIEGVGGMAGVVAAPVTVNNDNSTNISTSTNQGNSNVNVGNGTLNNNEITSVTITELIQQIESADANPEQQQEAKSLLAKLASDPLICAVVGGAVSGLVTTAVMAA